MDKTYWKRDLTIAIIQALAITILLFYLGQSNNTVKHLDIINALATNTKELNNEPGIILNGTAGDYNKKLISIGIGIDHTKINEVQLKQVIEKYLNDSAAMTNEHDWKKLFLPYNLKIEEIGDSNNGKILAEKQVGKTELVWKED
ncbi:hypothetical protein [Paenibacillus sp. SI8]|uniref:hypothetical protein n=1 Tax=unclassified Paenibacillus TaxID=185978 RepID=UPI0034656394